MTLQEIKDNWTEADKWLYKEPQIKLASLEQEKTRVIAKQQNNETRIPHKSPNRNPRFYKANTWG